MVVNYHYNPPPPAEQHDRLVSLRQLISRGIDNNASFPIGAQKKITVAFVCAQADLPAPPLSVALTYVNPESGEWQSRSLLCDMTDSD